MRSLRIAAVQLSKSSCLSVWICVKSGAFGPFGMCGSSDLNQASLTCFAWSYLSKPHRIQDSQTRLFCLSSLCSCATPSVWCALPTCSSLCAHFQEGLQSLLLANATPLLKAALLMCWPPDPGPTQFARQAAVSASTYSAPETDVRHWKKRRQRADA